MWCKVVIVWVFVQILEVFGREDSQDSITRINRPVMRSTEDLKDRNGIVTCSCNLPSCVQTGYMCKSTLGVCFADLPHGHAHGLYGCINDEAHIGRCLQRTTSSENDASANTENRSRFSCCYKDMCNHADVTLIVREPQNGPQKQYYNDADNQRMSTNTNDEVLFKVATIAVPICGCVILLLLIMLAVKILRTESMHGFNNNKFGIVYCKKQNCQNTYSASPSHHNYPFHDVLLPNNNHKNHPVYHPNNVESRELLPVPHMSPSVSIDVSSKNETHARLNYINDYSHKSALLYEKDIHKCYDNVSNNLATSQQQPKLPEHNQSCPNLDEVVRAHSLENNELCKENSEP